jgi:cytoskeletal protein CcmA (bactofilin family)
MPRADLMKSYIGEHASFSGKFLNNQVLTIDGRFEGERIDVNELFIGKTGKVKSGIKANYVIVEGIVIGDIEAGNRVILMPSAKVLGKITTNELIIQKGVIFEGTCVILNQADPETTRSDIQRLYEQDN